MEGLSLTETYRVASFCSFIVSLVIVDFFKAPVPGVVFSGESQLSFKCKHEVSAIMVTGMNLHTLHRLKIQKITRCEPQIYLFLISLLLSQSHDFGGLRNNF